MYDTSVKITKITIKIASTINTVKYGMVIASEGIGLIWIKQFLLDRRTSEGKVHIEEW